MCETSSRRIFITPFQELKEFRGHRARWNHQRISGTRSQPSQGAMMTQTLYPYRASQSIIQSPLLGTDAVSHLSVKRDLLMSLHVRVAKALLCNSQNGRFGLH